MLTVCRHAHTRSKWICCGVGNEPRHKTRGIRGFILFHSILHGRQPPREYGIKLLRRLTEDDENRGPGEEDEGGEADGSRYR